MDTYSVLRAFADSWVLLFLVLVFLGVIVWVFRPGGSREHRDSANIIFRHEDAPSDESPRAPRAEPDPKEDRE
ncbi:cbb3-type cytochrome c oxidase subunit 3 [Tropicimonas isoalkanivorans]|uniref:Cytochrome c oxidase cbb3-type subunit 4 n=1 Tax=Tropicimonas isoalkanivorans TaxID=441112 RepID=A0A1I1QRE9_9RHOB|nr:cbb3-type cytochrome c oxidase subunit 3 [Tropicimonas isoalkanivorans]SFD24704.1 cytochrome c oxidase cbb3-type subunit 4 [Tropicimonas isoalkanivorans]